MLSRIATLAVRHPRRLAAAGLVLLLAGMVAGGGASNALNARNDFQDPGSGSAHARRQLEAATGAAPLPGVIALVRRPAGDPQVAATAQLLRGDGEVASVAPPVAARDGRSTVLAVTLRAGDTTGAAVDHLAKLLSGQRSVLLGGSTVAQHQVGQQAASDLGLAELLAFPLLALLAWLVFRGIAALLPLAVGATSVFTAFAVLRMVNSVLPLSQFALNLVIGLGLGLAVDYSLFLVSRFREELGAGSDVPAAVSATMRSAGRTVLYSAVTVAVAMSSLTVFPLRFLQSMGIGGAIVALLAAAVSIVILPALFVLLGKRLGGVRPGPPEQGRWYQLAKRVLRRPALVATLAAGAMLLLALPAVRTVWSGVDASVLPASRSAHQVETVLRRDYPTLSATPAVAAVQAGPRQGPAVRAYAARLATIPGVRETSASYAGAGTWEVRAILPGDAIAPPAQRAVRAIRGTPSAFAVVLGGTAAEFADQRSAIAASLPLALGILLAGTLIVLWLMTGSAVLPIKSLLMNALTVGAATGLLVLVFQDGRLRGPLGYTPQGGIEQSDYIVLAAIAFALSTDYGVFLLTRIKEARDSGADDNEAIALGLQRTGRIVSAAAVLLSVAIGAFATSQVVFLKEIGIGAVAAVLLDAFVVRTLLVPSLMGLLGRWNWWAPAPLRRLHRRVRLGELPA